MFLALIESENIHHGFQDYHTLIPSITKSNDNAPNCGFGTLVTNTCSSSSRCGRSSSSYTKITH